MISVTTEVSNQKGTPMMYSDVTASRPTFGIVGRLFVATDSPYGIFRDTGSAWVQIAAGGSGTNIYNSDGTLTSSRTVSGGGFTLIFDTASTTLATTTTMVANQSNQNVYSQMWATYASAFSGAVGGFTFSALNNFFRQTFTGSATFDSANIVAGMVSINRVQNTSAGTITMTQTGTARSMSGFAVQNQYNSTVNTTISHMSGLQIYGVYKGSTGTLTATQYYALLINDNNEYSGTTITNSYGIYQAGVGDRNILRGQTIVGGVSQNSGKPLVINGDLEFVTTLAGTSGGSSGQHLNIWVNGTQYKIALNLV